MSRVNYEYHPKDKKYLDGAGRCHIKFYPEILDVCKANECDSFVDGIVKIYKEQKSLRNTGKIIGLSDNAVRNHLLDIGIKLFPRGGFNRQPAETYHGAPCKHGHTERYKFNNSCKQCMADASKRYRERHRRL